MQEKDLTDNDLKFFEEIIQKNIKQNNDCIEWTGTFANGYGIFRFFKRSWAMHRISYLIVHKKIQPNLYICHKCNNKKCINVNHLYEGTPKQSTRDLIISLEYPEIKKRIIENKKKKYEKKERSFKKHLDEYFTVQEMAYALQVHANTILNCLHTGYMQGIRTGNGKKSSYRIPRSELTRIGLFNTQEIIENILKQREKNSENKDCTLKEI